MERKHSVMSTSFIMCGSFYIIRGAFSYNMQCLCCDMWYTCHYLHFSHYMPYFCYHMQCLGRCMCRCVHEVIAGSCAVLCFSSLFKVCVLYYDVKSSRDLGKSF